MSGNWPMIERSKNPLALLERSIPLPSTLDFTEPNKIDNNNPVDSQIGSIRYLADHTRPDLLASAGILGSHVRNPSNRHIKGLSLSTDTLKVLQI
jgi:hypothetical protein